MSIIENTGELSGSEVPAYIPTRDENRLVSVEYVESAEPTRGEIEEVTPFVAACWLERNMHNRAVGEPFVKKYAADIVSGAWRLQGDPIRFDTAGEMIDGQHRLNAIVLAGVPVRSYVVRGLDPEVRDFLDAGKARSVADVLTVNGTSGSQAKKLAAAGVFAFEWSKSGQCRTGSNHPRSQYVDFITEHRAELLEAIASTQAAAMSVKINPAFFAALYLFVRRPDLAGVAGVPLGVEGDHFPDVAEFVVGVKEGAGLETNDPVLLWRNWHARVIASQTPPAPTVRVAALVEAWNAWVQGLRPNKLRVPVVSGISAKWPGLLVPGLVEVDE